MGKLIAGGTLLFTLTFAPMAFGQVIPLASPDHVHFDVPNVDKAVDWYLTHFGGARVKDAADQIAYGKTVFRFTKRDDAKPSDGSVIDRVGFTVSDVDAKVAEVVADGGKVLMPVRPGQVAFVQDPWGGKVEILHQPNESNRLFLISLRSSDPESLMKWVSETVGGQPDKLLGRLDGIKYGDLWIIFQKSDGETTPSRGHAIDHLGWPVPDMADAMAKLKSKGYKITLEPRTAGGRTFAFIEGPNGVAVELTQTGNPASK